MKVDEYIEKNLSVCAAEYAQVRKESYILANESDEMYSANLERLRKLRKREEELEYSLHWLAMCIAGYEFEEIDGVLQYVKK